MGGANDLGLTRGARRGLVVQQPIRLIAAQGIVWPGRQGTHLVEVKHDGPKQAPIAPGIGVNHRGRAGSAQDGLGRLCAVTRSLDRHADHARASQGQDRGQVQQRVIQLHTHPIAALQADITQVAAQAPHQGFKSGVGQGLVGLDDGRGLWCGPRLTGQQVGHIHAPAPALQCAAGVTCSRPRSAPS